MRSYEFTAVFRVKEDNYATGLKNVKEIFEKNGVTTLSEEDMGDRLLAYPVLKDERGHYHLLNIDADPAGILKIENALKLQTSLLRYLFVKKEK
ncbi:30S ribosomal protein S6 [Oceanispirochaeta sp.]|jgi:small subunit ribosomal protein S6|uniref:30S ribosomal protein S6 n=1 Tax=Oceanispirochaeta sp. TaxID=2035350 RepID=UPI00261B1CD0|nr:30S ribosomal protein S6 [Oceanispirochaeta sp.]MDA3956625.1 30S ribosomal protein S6 [Oceanispirochaeta sp.]